MGDSDKIDCIIDYLEEFDEALWYDFLNGNEITRPIIDAKKSVVDEIIDYIKSL